MIMGCAACLHVLATKFALLIWRKRLLLQGGSDERSVIFSSRVKFIQNIFLCVTDVSLFSPYKEQTNFSNPATRSSEALFACPISEKITRNSAFS